MTCNDKQKILPLAIATICVVSTISLLPVAEAHYHKGWAWDSTNHSDEFHNNKVPMAFIDSELRLLTLADGTSLNDIYTKMEEAVNMWDTSTNFDVVKHDTTSSTFDNKVGTADLGANTLGTALTKRHMAGGWNIWDLHIVRVSIDLNKEDVIWDHNGDNDVDNTTTPKQLDTINVYNVMLHEMGHVSGLCDTYEGATTQGNCHAHLVTSTVMDLYEFGVTAEIITSGDVAEVNGHYGN